MKISFLYYPYQVPIKRNSFLYCRKLSYLGCGFIEHVARMSRKICLRRKYIGKETGGHIKVIGFVMASDCNYGYYDADNFLRGLQIQLHIRFRFDFKIFFEADFTKFLL